MRNINPEVVIISDIHLGTFGSHAKELLLYLDNISPSTLILNGDIIDIWNFRSKYFPESHIEVIRKILKLAHKGVQVYYIPGNHDEKLREFIGMRIGNIRIMEKLILDLDGKKHWIFHGDVFDSTTKGVAKWLAKFGGKGYDLLIRINYLVNKFLVAIGKEKRSFSKQVKSSVKKAVTWINNFEETAIDLAIEDKYDYVICGHIHQPQIRMKSANGFSTTYLNSGDWIENCTALEYSNNEWSIYTFDKHDFHFDKHFNDEIKRNIKLSHPVKPVHLELVSE
jgi:UDP-2,3-diacylglucosamine pyrophosphatase LpxH